ncbi:hypothetical protein PLEOSDRAFT_1105483 [Pleurotus ostreatus PC15]|uniref:Uncharacterized protein n=1 Tax=Pleurotus ostreatus (strain PC15) TaxID=1137138 RepID=A0A067NFE6_PLEO1|nr:hypothetical protein PLEOSDRAFT_1105483 [Pleurotus ostreatus PC15]
MLRLAKLSTAIWMLGCSTGVILALKNVTIDDRFGDELTHIVPTFTPVDGWWLGSAGGTGGFAKPSASLAYNKTWLDSTHKVGEVERMVNFGFTGVSLYVYCIIANSQDFPTFADYKFLMDGELVGTYTHYAEKPFGYLYNTPVYVNRTLKNEFHNFTIVVDSIEQPVLLLFDYAIYTATSDDLVNQPSSRFPIPTPIPPSNVGADVGRTLGAFTLGLFLGMLLLVVYRRQKTQGISGWRLANVRETTRRWVPDFRKNIATIVESTHQSRLSLAVDASTQAPAHGRRDLDTRDRAEELREIRQEVQTLRAEQRTMIMAISMPRSPPPYNV